MQSDTGSTKPEFLIDLSKGANSSLEAFPILKALDPSEGYKISQGLRPPLGIYNISISRICGKVINCCQRLERYFRTSTRTDVLMAEHELRQEVIDYLELSLYSAAEHVDDVILIAKGFFSSTKDYKSSKPATELNRQVKKHKALIAACTNAIKHSQARIRLYSLEFNHGGIESCLHGIFIEGVHSGIVGPNKIFHNDERQVFSITSIIWEIICFLLHSSRCLLKFLSETTGVGSTASISNCELFSKAVIATARLPLYSFDDEHPFSQTRIVITQDDTGLGTLDSGIYGSISCKWTNSNDGKMGSDMTGYEGDGVTKEFKLVKPMAVKIQHWK